MTEQKFPWDYLEDDQNGITKNFCAWEKWLLAMDINGYMENRDSLQMAFLYGVMCQEAKRRQDMTETDFWHKHFRLKGIPQGSDKPEDFEKCKLLVQRDGKLSSRRYNELLKIARDWVGV